MLIDHFFNIIVHMSIDHYQPLLKQFISYLLLLI